MRRLNRMTYFFFSLSFLGFDQKLKFYSCVCIIGVPSREYSYKSLWEATHSSHLYIALFTCTPFIFTNTLTSSPSFFLLPQSFLLFYCILLFSFVHSTHIISTHHPLPPNNNNPSTTTTNSTISTNHTSKHPSLPIFTRHTRSVDASSLLTLTLTLIAHS